jgi:hypothetical protein
MLLLPQTGSLRQELEIYAIFTTSVGLLLQRLGRLHPKIGTHPKWICVLHQLGFEPTNDVLRPGLCCHTGQIGFLRLRWLWSLGLEPQKWKWNFDQNWNEATPTANGLTSGNQNLKVPRNRDNSSVPVRIPSTWWDDHNGRTPNPGRLPCRPCRMKRYRHGWWEPNKHENSS